MSICTVFGVAAEDSGITVTPDYTSYVITLSGFAGEEYSGKLVNIQIFNPIGEDVTELPEVTTENIDTVLTLFSNTGVKTDGSFEYKFKLSQSAAAENPFWARVDVDAAGAENPALMFTDSFSYTSKQQIDAKLEELKTEIDIETFEADAELLGITLPAVWSELDSAQRSYAAGIISAKIAAAEDSFTTEKLAEYTTDAVMMTAAKDANTAEQLKAFLTAEVQKSYFGIDLENTYYTEMTPAKQTEVFARMFESISAESTKEDIAVIFRESLLLESVQNASYKNTIGSIIEEFADVISSENMEDYNSISGSTRLNNIYSDVIGASDKELATMDAFNEMFAEAIKNSGKKSSSSSSGSGSSSGFGSGGLVMPELPNSAIEGTVISEKFADISGHEWAREAIESLYDKGVISGKGEGLFCPDDHITREEIVKMICDAVGIAKNTEANYFKDAEGKWFEGYVNAAYEKGIVSGIDAESFGAGLKATREDIMVIMARAVGTDETGAAVFADDDEISGYAKNAVWVMSQKGIVSGYPDGSFRPKNAMTRAEAAVVIYNLLKSNA